MSESRRPPTWAGLFLLAAVAYGYFHPGGGWNQNARFAMVRALVEERRVAIDSFLVYERAALDGDALRRVPARDGVIQRDGTPVVLTWTGTDRKPVAVSATAPGNAPRVKIEDVGVTGDVAFHAGHFHPNKAPGTSFAAAPAYAALYGLERALGVDPDRWLVLTLNAWLSSWLSVGLISAAGLLLFFDVARRLSGDAPAALFATFALGFGTLYWSYATMLREHNLIAVALLGAYVCLRAAASSAASPVRALALSAGAGACAGAAVVANYIAIVPAAFLGVYLVAAAWPCVPTRQALAFGAGLAGPLIVLGLYHDAAFGRWLTTSYRYENPLFVSTNTALLGVLEWPQPERLLLLTLSPFRGLFVSSPVLLLGLLGLRRMWRHSELRLDVALFAAIAGFFLAFNISFNGWHGGWATGPRYLVPAFPFLALPIAWAVGRPARWMSALLAVSVALNALANAVDPDAPVGIAGHARKPGTPQWAHSPLLDYQLPLLTAGSVQPVLAARREALVAKVAETWEQEGRSRTEIHSGLTAVRAEIDAAIERGDEPFELGRVRGFVSANPMGVYETWYFRLFAPGSTPALQNSFNIGEAVLPGSRASLLPLVAGLLWGMRALRRAVAPAPSKEAPTGPSPSRPGAAAPTADRRRPRASRRRA